MRLPNLTQLRYFVAVADTLSFRKASEALHIAQPAVSRSVQMLEAELGFNLLNRTTRHVELTQAGALLANDVKQAMQLLDRSIQHCKQLATGIAGELFVAYSVLSAQGPMPDLVLEFRRSHPSVIVTLYQMASDEQPLAMEAGQIDLGFMLSAACRTPLSHLTLYRDRFVLLVSRHHPLSRRESIALRELKETPFVAGANRRWATFTSLGNAACRNAGFVPRVVEEAGDVPVLLQLVAQQRGVALYGSAVASGLRADVVAVPISDPDAGFDVSLVWDESRIQPLAQEFVSFVKTTCE